MASEVKHTAGPWAIIPATPYDGDDEALEGSFVMPASIEGADGNPVCIFGDCFGSGSLYENEADYHLIAACPDLYEALDPETLEAIADEIGGDFKHSARAASLRGIAKRQRAALLKASPSPQNRGEEEVGLPELPCGMGPSDLIEPGEQHSGGGRD